MSERLAIPEGAARVEPYGWFRVAIPEAFDVEAFRLEDGSVTHAIVAPLSHVSLIVPEQRPRKFDEQVKMPALRNLCGYIKFKAGL